ncbi:MAG: hypothetical protein AB1744_05145 [Candidatus Zixiibacteriota bacterium]
MEGLSDFRREFVRAIYEQHWQQIRQTQRERTWLLLIFLVIAGASLIAWQGDYFNASNWPHFVFLMAISLLGLFVSLKMQITLKAHLASLEMILSRYTLSHYLPRYRQNMARRMMRISRMIPKFYLFWFSFFLWMLLYSISGNAWRSAIIPVIVYLAAALIVYFSRFDEPLPHEED